MKKIIILTLLLSACSSKDDQFCKCMAISEEFNEAANDLLNDKKTSMTSEERMALKKKKDEACAKYVAMPGDEMLKLKAKCD